MLEVDYLTSGRGDQARALPEFQAATQLGSASRSEFLARQARFPHLLGRLNGEALDRISWALDTVGLRGRVQDLAGSLSHGQKQWLEIGMLLVQDTQLILLDEPVAGMTDAETAATAQLILQLVGQRTLVVVEHDMEFVRDLGARVTVLHEGSVLAEGSLDQVQNDQRVIEVYLGR